jgi:hypothetical protein
MMKFVAVKASDAWALSGKTKKLKTCGGDRLEMEGAWRWITLVVCFGEFGEISAT